MSGYEKTTVPVNIPSGQEKVTLAAITLTKKTPGIRRPSPSTSPGLPRPETRPPSQISAGGGKMGSLSVQSRPWSKVHINGRFIKNTPLVNHKLKPGNYRITLENPTYNINKTFRVKRLLPVT